MKKMRKKTAFGTEFAFHSGRSAAFLLLALSFFLQVSTPDLRGADLPAIHIASDGKNAASASLGETSAENVPSKSETPAPPASQASSGESSAASKSETGGQSTAGEAQTVYVIPVETASFNGIVPGKTTREELHKLFGKPANSQKDGVGKGIDLEEFELEGFKAAAFHIIDGKVYGIIAEFPEAIHARQLAKDLGTEHIQSVFLTDEKGTIKGEIFPEIGLAFGYDPSKPLGKVEDMANAPESIPMNTIQIIFQPVGPDPFLLRAETWVDVDPKRAHTDILQALKLDPKNEKALAYRKVLEEAVPELKNAKLPVSPQENAQTDAPQGQSSPKTETGTEGSAAPETADSQTAASDGSGTEEASSSSDVPIDQLDPPSLETIGEELADVPIRQKKSDVSENRPESGTPEQNAETALTPEENAKSGSLPETEKEGAELEAPGIRPSLEELEAQVQAELGARSDTPEKEAAPKAEEADSTALPDTLPPALPADTETDLSTEEGETVPEAAAEIPETNKKTEAGSADEQAPELPPASVPSVPAVPEEKPLPPTLDAIDQDPAQLPQLPDQIVLPEEPASTGSFRPLTPEQKAAAPLDLPSDLNAELTQLDPQPGQKSEMEDTAPPQLTFEDELFEKVEYLARNQHTDQAMELLTEMRKRFVDNPFVLYRSNLLEGDILMVSGISNAEQAFLCHRRAAEQGENLLESGKSVHGRKYPLTLEERLRVQRILLDSWLGIAGDIAVGPWEPKTTNCRKWLEKISQLAGEMTQTLEKNAPDEAVRLRYRIAFQSLTIAVSLGQHMEQTPYAEAFLNAGMEMLKNAAHAQEYYQICMESSLLLDDTATVSLQREEIVLAQKYLKRAISMMEQVRSHKKKSSTEETFLLSQLYYHQGRIFAFQAKKLEKAAGMTLAQKNRKKTDLHAEAVKCYERSIPYLMEVIRSKQWKDLQLLGRIVNGMSVSYTETHDIKRAVILVKTGIYCLEQYVQNHPEEKMCLRIPYRNMIRLLEFQGDEKLKAEYQKKLQAILL